MIKVALAMVVLSFIAIPEAWSFQPGEHVTVGKTNQTGTVLQDTGKLVKVHIDSSGYSADVGLWFDKEQDNVTSGAGGGKAAVSDGKNSAQTHGENNASAANSSQPGSHIRVGSTGQTGTVLEDKGTMVKIHIDNSGYPADVGVWFDKEQLKEPGGAAGATMPQTPTNIVGNPGNLNAAPKQPAAGVNPVNQNQVNQVNNAFNADKGVGAPPDGIYTCNKISGRSYIHIGTIEIRGGTYKGFSSQQGSFHPYTIDGSGSIVWTAGLTSLPDGWTLKPGKYVGLDYRGRPLIRVYYNSNRGAAEVVDATKEK